MNKILFLMGAVTLICTRGFAGDPPTVIQSEFAKQEGQLEKHLFEARHQLEALETARTKAIQTAQNEAKKDEEGVRNFKRYYSLLLNRYADENAQFQPWRAIQNEDVDNINKLFETYLASHPLKAPVSAGQADKTLDWGMTRLEELYKVHNSPKPDNNSELEIINHQVRETETRIDSIRSQASRLDIKLLEKDPRDNASDSSN
jgi:hypothetical protein